MNKLRRIASVSMICLTVWIGISGQASSQYLTEVWQHRSLGEYLGYQGLHVADINGDGANEVIFTGWNPSGSAQSAHVFSLRPAGSTYNIGAASPPFIHTSVNYYTSPIAWTALRDIPEESYQLVYVLDIAGAVHILDGRTMAPVDTLLLSAANASKMVIIDVNGDGKEELVVGSGSWIRIYNIETGDLTWQLSRTISDFAIGDVTGDGRNNIVLSSGTVLDGTTLESVWEYVDGFGTRLALGRLDDEPSMKIFGTAGRRVVVYDASRKTPLWEIDTQGEIGAFAVGDLDGDGIAEIVVGPRSWDRVRVFDAITRQAKWTYYTQDFGTTNFAWGDTNGDGNVEVVFGAGHYSSGQDRLHIVDVSTGQGRFTTQDIRGPFFAALGSDLGDGRREILAASTSVNSGYDRGRLWAFDGQSHEVLWTSHGLSGVPYYWEVTGLGYGESPAMRMTYLATNDHLLAFHGESPALLWSSAALARTRVMATGDLNNTGVPRLAVGGTAGRVSIVNQGTGAIEWQSITTNLPIGGIRLADVDDDDALEIVFFNENGRLHIYDGVTRLLKWVSDSISYITAMDVVDATGDAKNNIVLGLWDGTVVVLEHGTFEEIDRFRPVTTAINAIRLTNVDDTVEPELLLTTSRLHVFSWPEKVELWRGYDHAAPMGKYHGLHVADVNADGYMNVVVSGPHGVTQFASGARYPDTTPPRVISASPARNRMMVSRDVRVSIDFSEPMDLTSVQDHVAALADSVVISVVTHGDMDDTRLTIEPTDEWPASAHIQIILRSTLSDPAGNPLAGGEYVQSFYTGTGIDTLGPAIIAMVAERDTVWQGVNLRVSGIASDSSTVGASTIAAAEFFIDSVGSYGSGQSIDAEDGSFSRIAESFTFTVPTADLDGGPHEVFVRARDSRGQWGELASKAFFVRGGSGSNWPQFAQNPANTGFNADDSISVPLRLEWSRSTSGDGGWSGPVVLGDALAVSGYDGGQSLYVLDAATGEERWSFSFGSSYGIGMPAIAYGKVYVQTSNHTPGSFVSAFDLSSGNLLWQSPFGSQWSYGQAPTVADGKVFVNAGYYGGMYAYDAFSGEAVWSVSLPQQFDWTPIYYEGNVYAAWHGSSYYEFNARSGAHLYTHGSPGWWARSGAIHDGVLFTVEPVAAIDLTTRSVLWSKSGSDTPAIAYGKVFVVANARLNVYDEKSGATLWSFNGDGALQGVPIVANGYVFVRGDGRTYAVDIEARQSVWSFPAAGTMAIAGNRLFIGGDDGTLYAFASGTSIAADQPDDDLPRQFVLEQNYPNPFNPTTTIRYGLSSAGNVQIDIFNALGQQMETIVAGYQDAGWHEVRWDARDVGSGMYYYRVSTGSQSLVRSMVVIK